jgi:hypothetical protein
MAGNTLNEHVGSSFSAIGSSPGYDARQDEHGCIVVTQGGGKYKEPTKRGKMFSAINATARAVPASFTTTCPLLVYNPAGSGIRAIIKKVSFSPGVTGTQGNGRISHGKITLNGPGGSQGGVVPTGTAVTPQNLDLGGPNNSAMTVLEQATIVAGVELYHFCNVDAQVDATTVAVDRRTQEDVDGNIVVEPGAGWFLSGVTANQNTPLCFISVVWEEEPIAS